jgi:AraC family transcriptional regulator, transcriptional activator of pobA
LKNIPNISFQSIENKVGFELLDLSKLFLRLNSIENHNPTLPHKISFFALLIVTKGKGKHQIDFKEYDLEEGTVLKIAKSQVHAFQKYPAYEGYLIIFTEDFVINYFPKPSINLISHLYNYHSTSPILINKKGNEELVNQINTELNSTETYAHNNIIAAILNLYLLKLERMSSNFQLQTIKTKKYDTFIQFKNLVESQYTSSRNVKDYADKMLISTKLINQVVQEFTSHTAKSFIDDYVILEAKRDFVSTNKSIKEIAFGLGFDEVTNFTKFFKKHTGTTPKDFKMVQQ